MSPASPDDPGQAVGRATVVRYVTRPEAAEENEALIEAVFAELDEKRPDDFRYVAVRLEDGVSFVHVALFDGEHNPLPALSSFGGFLAGLATRCVDGPAPVNGTVIGDFGTR